MRLGLKAMKSKNFENFFPHREPSGKEKIIKKCESLGVCIYVEDVSEDASSNNIMRGLASEAELQRRIDGYVASRNSTYALWVSLVACALSMLAFIKSVLVA